MLEGKRKFLITNVSRASVTLLAIFLSTSCKPVDYVKQMENEAAQLRRPPPKPPNCQPLPELANITLSDGKIADVRIFRFHQTILYIPVEWLRLEKRFKNYRGEITPPGLNDVGHFVPDFEMVECPGVVHTISGTGYRPARHPGINIVFRDRTERNGQWSRILGDGAAEIESIHLSWPRTPVANFENIAGLVSDFQHDPYQVHIGLNSDVLGQFDWRRGEISKEIWNKAELERFEKNRKFRLSLPMEEQAKATWGPGAWTDPPVGTPEWSRMTTSVRALVHWLATPPQARSVKFMQFLGDKRTARIESYR